MRGPAVLAYRINPVMRRELVERMRGRTAAVVLTLYLAVLAGILLLAYNIERSGTGFQGPLPTEVTSVGRATFEWLVMLMMVLVLFVVPGMTAGAVAGERERQTLVPLQVTQLRPLSILLGKLGASIAFLVLLVIASVPLFTVSYLIGGIGVWDVLGGSALVVLIGLVVGAVCVAISTFVRRVTVATVAAYGLVFLWLLGTTIVAFLLRTADENRNDVATEDLLVQVEEGFAPGGVEIFEDGGGRVIDMEGAQSDRSEPTRSSWPRRVMLFNPLVPLSDALVDANQHFMWEAPDTPVRAMADLIHGDVRCEPVGDGEVSCWDNHLGLEADPPTQMGTWWKSSLALIVVGAGALGLASWRLRTPAQRER